MIVLTRRRFLQGMTAAGAAALGQPACSKQSRAIEPATPRPARPILVVGQPRQGGPSWTSLLQVLLRAWRSSG